MCENGCLTGLFAYIGEPFACEEVESVSVVFGKLDGNIVTAILNGNDGFKEMSSALLYILTEGVKIG